MSRYHVNPATGNAGVCKATKSCPFGDMEKDHYGSKVEARQAYEKTMENGALPEPQLDPGRWHRSGWDSVAQRIYTQSETAYAENLLQNAYDEIKGLALGPGGDTALRQLDDGLRPQRPTYPWTSTPFEVEGAQKALTKARSRIGNHNPSANERLQEVQKKIAKMAGKPPLPKKNSEVTYAYRRYSDSIEVGVATFVKAEKVRGSASARKQWGSFADKEYAVLRKDGREFRVGLGSVKEPLIDAPQLTRGEKITVKDRRGEPLVVSTMGHSAGGRVEVELVSSDGYRSPTTADYDEATQSWVLAG